MSEKFYGEKLKRAAHLLLFKRGKLPGAREWELKARLGRSYLDVISQLNGLLADFDLEVKKVENRSSDQPSTEEEARYLVTLKGSLTPRESKMIGWRIDNLAALAVSLSYLTAKQGKAPREELEKILAHKFGRWKSLTLIDVFERSGYMEEDDTGTLSLGWRTRAEVDLRNLMTLLAETKP